VQAQLSQQDLDAARGQAAWHERERHKAALQVTRLSDELEAARAEATRLKQQLHDRDRRWGGQEQTWTQVREEARERQERFDALAAERAELVTRVGVLEKEKVGTTMYPVMSNATVSPFSLSLYMSGGNEAGQKRSVHLLM
jgi:chromosome segregation ATPase